MHFEEYPLHFCCHDAWLYGIASLPVQAGMTAPATRGVLIVVGGPQYRVGSHRQFTLLARHLAAQGIPAFRFDYRGMGDSDGAQRTFEDIHDDLRCAINAFLERAPGVTELVIWGLCDAASAALFYARHDPRITGLVLLNPWVRTDESMAKATLKHYYTARLLEPELWNKIREGQFSYTAAITSLFDLLRQATSGSSKAVSAAPDETAGTCCGIAPLPERMQEAFQHFNGRMLLILSGDDLTAKEFTDLVAGSGEWQQLLASPRVTRRDFPEANHTFSRKEWRDRVSDWTAEWVQSW